MNLTTQLHLEQILRMNTALLYLRRSNFAGIVSGLRNGHTRNRGLIPGMGKRIKTDSMAIGRQFPEAADEPQLDDSE